MYVFVGGAPLWQESCDAPVSCGTPVKVPNWSIDARDHMNRVPADGNLVQTKAGTVDLPVAMTVGGALIPFASPQEVIDVGQGGDWGQRVVAISAGSYNLLGFSPADGTLVHGTGGGVSGPVAMAVGGAFIPFANVQELIDVGQGDNWASRVRAIPLRAFDAHPRVPSDSVLFQGTGGGASAPVAALVGGARVNFASPQEIIDSGYGTDWLSKVRAIPLRAFSEIRDDLPIDGTLVQAQGTPVAAVIGNARVNFANPQEVVDSGYSADWQPLVRIIPARVFNAMPTKIADGTRLRKAGSSSQSGIIGGARVDFHSMAELEAAGYGPRPTQTVPARVWDGLTTRIADGTYVKSPDSAQVWLVSGGSRTPASQSSGVQVIPARVLEAIPPA
ncbi:hypothetical protein [Nonomuraea sp. NPDC050691]|uniref:hypothetical protein n=1 Tax=Nonomuraea sp. NPDC050691 TaxID=3155661 RepID=UPI0033D553ED